MVTVAKSFDAPIKRKYCGWESYSVSTTRGGGGIRKGMKRKRAVFFSSRHISACFIGTKHTKSGPALVVFPKDLLELGLSANKLAMLGLGDIVIPGLKDHRR